MSKDKITFAYRLEDALVAGLIALFKALGPTRASRFGGWLAGTLGPLIPTSKVADRNLRLAMPELTAAQRQAIVRQCWASFGATAGELAHLGRIRPIGPETKGPGYIVEGWEDNIAPSFAQNGPGIFLTAHLGNWEVLPSVAHAHGHELGFMYRAASNPLVNARLLRLRAEATGRPPVMFPKGAAGARAAYGWLLKGGQLGLLVDQKLDTGLSVPFFGHNAMTMDAMAAFALKFRCPVYPVRTLREGPARIRIICAPPLVLPDTGGKEGDMYALTLAMNQLIEAWVRETPGQWLWLHRRWPKAATRDL
ncbi:lauroyl acyltransferase [Acidocella sp.]|uniref:LpxL/LpxP family acyltransferase n=1 Tax=Acidocella sp. TaxID=50710 RepID=UPI0026386B4E|nr:lauroyl acyltransferase [Acidocella sp.]